MQTTTAETRAERESANADSATQASGKVPFQRYVSAWDRVKCHIDEHLADPALSAEGIAAATFVSKRQLYRIFQANHVTVSEWIRDRRLQHCYRDLLHPAFANRTVAEIAYNWGFAAPSHFSRAFRARYGQSPSELRATASVSATRDGHEYSHLIAKGPKLENWLANHYDVPPAPGQAGKVQLRVLVDGNMVPNVRRHVICNWIDRRNLNPRNLPSGLSHEAAEIISGMDGGEYEEYVAETSAVPTHVHPVDELLLFIGTDPRNPDVLGAEVELCLGEKLETHLIQSTTAVWIPATLPHCPLRIRRVQHPFLLVTILEAPEYI